MPEPTQILSDRTIKLRKWLLVLSLIAILAGLFDVTITKIPVSGFQVDFGDLPILSFLLLVQLYYFYFFVQNVSKDCWAYAEKTSPYTSDKLGVFFENHPPYLNPFGIVWFVLLGEHEPVDKYRGHIPNIKTRGTLEDRPAVFFVDNTRFLKSVFHLLIFRPEYGRMRIALDVLLPVALFWFGALVLIFKLALFPFWEWLVPRYIDWIILWA